MPVGHRLFPGDIEKGGDLWLMLITSGFTLEYPQFRTGQDMTMMGDGRTWFFDRPNDGYIHGLGLRFVFSLENPNDDYLSIDSYLARTDMLRMRVGTVRHARNWEEAIDAIHWLREEAAERIAKQTVFRAATGTRN